MNIKIRNIFQKKKAASIAFECDKSSATRPAWITIRKGKKSIRFMTARINGIPQIYYVKLFWGVFVPIDYIGRKR